MYCENCGREISAGHKFCENCGYEVKISRFTIFQAEISRWLREHKNISSVIVLVLVGLAVSWLSGSQQTSTPSVPSAVVHIACDNGYGGSGTIMSEEGFVVTNEHVIANSNVCFVSIPDIKTGISEKIYEAVPFIATAGLSKEYDLAFLQVVGSYTDKNGKTWGDYPTKFSTYSRPDLCDTSPSELGKSIRIYGYPVTSGGDNLTITDGIISSFADDGSILTSAKVDSGNSGGLALDLNGCMIGIPSAVTTGKYQNLGVIIPVSAILSFIQEIKVKDSYGDTALVPSESYDQVCKDNYGTHSKSTGEVNKKGQPSCVCESSYFWNQLGNSCSSKDSLNQSCQKRYGSGSYSYPSESAPKSVCGCLSGYTWNADSTQCVVVPKTNDQICQEKYGIFTSWTGAKNDRGEIVCDCQQGYIWNSGRTMCTSPQIANNESCKNAYGPYSLWGGITSDKGSPICSCQYGYTWNINNTECVSNASLNQMCQTKYGSQSYYLGYVQGGSYMCQ